MEDKPFLFGKVTFQGTVKLLGSSSYREYIIYILYTVLLGEIQVDVVGNKEKNSKAERILNKA